jgi:hypothetical protein
VHTTNQSLNRTQTDSLKAEAIKYNSMYNIDVSSRGNQPSSGRKDRQARTNFSKDLIDRNTGRKKAKIEINGQDLTHGVGMTTEPDCDNEIAKAADGEDPQRATSNFGGPGMVNRIVEKLNRGQDYEGNVHERLHNEAKTRMMNRHYLMEMGMMDDYGDGNSEFTSHTGGRGNQQQGSCQMSSPLGGECSQRLYYEGIRNMQARENEINEVKLVRRDLEDRHLTHKPEMNKISTMIVNSKPRSKSVEQRLMMYGRARLDRQKVLQSVKYEQEVAECTFNPRVDPISTQIVNEKSRFMDDDMPRHEQLFH